MLLSILLIDAPQGVEWIIIIILGLVLIASPILAIVYYSQTKRLRKENKELLAKLLDTK